MPVTATIRTRRPRWTAGDVEGVAHAHHRSAPRTACGLPAIDERHAWPTRTRCEACVVALGLAGEATA